ncbi:hypothetical protein EQV77_05670 [Halobacillus fulvus]|nr:hypothetical protein EQV77_05670 [Halobacillus fulvus]
MSSWFDFSFLQQVIGWLDPAVLEIFGLDPLYVQFGLVFAFVMSLMWVVRPVIEWLMLKNWSTFSSYISSALLALVFLQLVDRYAMVQTTSLLPAEFWPISLLAMSSYGVVYSLLAAGKLAWHRLAKRHKNKAA